MSNAAFCSPPAISLLADLTKASNNRPLRLFRPPVSSTEESGVLASYSNSLPIPALALAMIPGILPTIFLPNVFLAPDSSPYALPPFATSLADSALASSYVEIPAPSATLASATFFWFRNVAASAWFSPAISFWVTPVSLANFFLRGAATLPEPLKAPLPILLLFIASYNPFSSLLNDCLNVPSFPPSDTPLAF